MSQEFSTSKPTRKPQLETAQSHQTFSKPQNVATPDVATPQSTDVASGFRNLKPANNPSMGRQEPGPTRSPDSATQTPSRTLGVQSILNPSQPESQDEGTAAHNASDRFSLHRMQAPQTPSLPASAGSPRVRKRNQRNSQNDEAQSSTRLSGPRRTLTPMSPGRRAASLDSRRQLPGLSAATQRPSLPAYEGRIYTAEPGTHPESDIPPLPSSTAFHREAPPHSYHPEGTQHHTRNASTSKGHPTAVSTFLNSQSESPSTSHSSYSHVGQVSPVLHYPQHSYLSRPAAPMAGYKYPAANSAYGESQYPASQGSYQMTLETAQGPMTVPVEVDLQQASKIADEKRKRNAGASARFRARRKEKEKEALHSISSMEKEVRDIAEERDYYINERNYFRDLVVRHLGPHQIGQRPPSPPPRRPLLPPLDLEDSATQGQETYRELSEPSPRPAVRRRTGDYRPSLSRGTSPAPMQPPRMPFPSQYPMQTPLPPPSAMPSLQGPYPEQRNLPPGPPAPRPPPPPAATRSQSYDPFRPDLFDRSWDPGR